MAQPEFTPAAPIRVVAPKPKMNIYFALLIVSLCCMLTGCLILYLEIRRFGGFGTVPQRISAVQHAEDVIAASRGITGGEFDSARARS